MDRAPTSTWAPAATTAVFFVAGLPALIYQIAWQRVLFLVFGIDIESVTVVVAVFMLGLGLGALAGGWLTRVSRVAPLIVFGVLELGICVFGVVSLDIFHAASDLALGNGRIANALLMAVILLVPTLMMGAGLPVLAAYVVRLTGNVGSSVGTLYFANTLGAAFACVLTATLLFPRLGLSASVHVAVLLNLVAGMAALLAHILGKREAAARAPAPPNEDQSVGEHGTGRRTLASAIVFASGAIALSQEILWVRIASFASEARASAFALTLGAVLLGIAIGARQAERICRRHPDAPDKLLSYMATAALAAAIVGYLGPGLTAHAASYGPAWAGVLMFAGLVTFGLWGAILPLAAHVGVPPDRRAGQGLSIIYTSNVVGSAAGAVLTGYVLLDIMGTRDVTLFLFVCGAVLAVVIAAAQELSKSMARPIAIRGLIAVAVGWGLSGPLFDDFHGRLLNNAERGDKTPVRDIVENRNGIIVIDVADRVFGGGVYDGVVSVDLVNDVNGIIRPYTLSLWHPAPRRVLVLGLSMGAWTQVLANHPDVAEVTVVEINPGYLDLIRRHPVVSSLLENPKVKIVTDDARRWMRWHPGETFDAIVQNTTINHVAFATNMLSAEYLKIVRDHLRPGGVFLYNATASARAIKTGCGLFTDGYRVFNSLVVSNANISIDPERLRRVVAGYRIQDRSVIDGGTPAGRALLTSLGTLRDMKFYDKVHADDAIESCRDLLARVPDVVPMTDDNMGNEWSR